MPVPGSLRRQPIDSDEIARLLEAQFNIPRLETHAYLQALKQKSFGLDELSETLGLSKVEADELLQNMILKGLVIRAPDSKQAFTALHPRMTMTNIFKVYEKEVVQSLRDRRATVDRVVNLLTPIFEERRAVRS